MPAIPAGLTGWAFDAPSPPSHRECQRRRPKPGLPPWRNGLPPRLRPSSGPNARSRRCRGVSRFFFGLVRLVAGFAIAAATAACFARAFFTFLRNCFSSAFWAGVVLGCANLGPRVEGRAFAFERGFTTRIFGAGLIGAGRAPFFRAPIAAFALPAPARFRYRLACASARLRVQRIRAMPSHTRLSNSSSIPSPCVPHPAAAPHLDHPTKEVAQGLVTNIRLWLIIRIGPNSYNGLRQARQRQRSLECHRDC